MLQGFALRCRKAAKVAMCANKHLRRPVSGTIKYLVKSRGANGLVKMRPILQRFFLSN